MLEKFGFFDRTFRSFAARTTELLDLLIFAGILVDFVVGGDDRQTILFSKRAD